MCAKSHVAVFGIRGDEEAVSRRDGEILDGGTVHEAAALELLREVALAVAAHPLDKLLVAKLVAVGDLCDTQGLCRAEAANHHLVGEEVLQAVRADILLALLLDLIVVDGQQLGRYRAVENIPQCVGEDLVLSVLGNVSHACTNLSFGKTHVDIVHAGVVAVVGAPAVDKLAEILGAENSLFMASVDSFDK